VKKGENSFEQSLKRLEYDMEWSMDRSDLVKKLIRSDIQRLRKRRTVNKVILAMACLFLIVGMSVFLKGNSFTSQLYTQTSAVKSLSVLEGERENLVYPLNAQNHLENIVGEPSISYKIVDGSKEQYLDTYATYYYTMNDHTTRIHIVSQKNEYPVDKMMDYLLPHKKYPSTSYNSTEIKVGNERAILTESKQEYGGIDLKLITKEYVYYFTTDLKVKDMTQAEKKQLKNDLIKLAELFNF
jgi:hypothetical protein